MGVHMQGRSAISVRRYSLGLSHRKLRDGMLASREALYVDGGVNQRRMAYR